jgi:hypothetical protein
MDQKDIGEIFKKLDIHSLNKLSVFYQYCNDFKIGVNYGIFW